MIANDKPLVVHYDNGWYFPSSASRKPPRRRIRWKPTTRARTSANCSRPGTPGCCGRRFPTATRASIRPEGTGPRPPSTDNLLGTDDQGRDVLARVIYAPAFRVFASTSTLLSSLIGVIAGALRGFYGGWVDLAGQRFLEIWSGLPVLYLLDHPRELRRNPTSGGCWGSCCLFSWMSLVDVVRAEFLRGATLNTCVQPGLGMQNGAIMFRHILPNAMVSTMTFMPFILTGAIGTLTALDILGFGLPARQSVTG